MASDIFFAIRQMKLCNGHCGAGGKIYPLCLRPSFRIAIAYDRRIIHLFYECLRWAIPVYREAKIETDNRLASLREIVLMQATSFGGGKSSPDPIVQGNLIVSWRRLLIL